MKSDTQSRDRKGATQAVKKSLAAMTLLIYLSPALTGCATMHHGSGSGDGKSESSFFSEHSTAIGVGAGVVLGIAVGVVGLAVLALSSGGMVPSHFD